MADVSLVLRAGLGVDPAHRGDHEAVKRLHTLVRELPDHVGRDPGTYPG
jgi:hypothetical protein